jgi:TPR repeat protein
VKRLLAGILFCCGGMQAVARYPREIIPKEITPHAIAKTEAESDVDRFDAATFSAQIGAYDSAFNALLPLAMKGYPQAQNFLGHLYAHGQGARKNIREALKWYYRAALQHLPEAEYNLGTMFELGKGVRKNYNIAYTWYSRAAEQGHANAQYGLATLLEQGLGTPKNIYAAAAWYEKAAEQRHTQAELHLGSMYASGEAFKKDPVEAYKWFYLASASNRDEPIEVVREVNLAREAIAQELTEEQLTKAKALANEWGRQFPKPDRPIPKADWASLGTKARP